MAASKQMIFRRYGRSYHLRIETAADLKQAAELDEAHWIATNAPVATNNCDATFLRLLDWDGNGRITPREIKTAISWLLGVLRDLSGVETGSDSLSLDAIDTVGEPARRVHQAVRDVINRANLNESDPLTLEQVRGIKGQIESQPVSETGVVLPEATEDEEIRQFIDDAVAATAGAQHPSGAMGIGRKQLEDFLAAAAEQLERYRRDAPPTEEPKTDILSPGPEKLQTYLEERFTTAVERLIATGEQVHAALENVHLAEKVLLYQANLIDLANNFISFPHLYDPTRRAMFEMGTLVMDGRRFNLAVPVDDRTRHAEIAGSSNMFVIYVEVTRDGADGTYEVALPVTSGGRGNLCIYKRGVFYDVTGREQDAKIVHIIENPVSLREAIVSPFKRLGRLVTGKIEAIAAKADKKLEASTSGIIPPGPVPPGASEGPGRGTAGLAAGGMLIGAGVALAAVGSAVAYITKTLAGLKLWTIGIAVLGAAMLVALPTSIVAFLKLRRRDLSAILEASGWAINARMRLTRAQRRFFTQRPRYPRGSRGIRGLSRWISLLVLLIAIAAAGMTLFQMHRRMGKRAATSPASTQTVPQR